MNNTVSNKNPTLSPEKWIELLSIAICMNYNFEEHAGFLEKYGVSEEELALWRKTYREKHNRIAAIAEYRQPENFLAIIPARMNSGGLKRKAMRLLGGKPVIAHTIETCLQSKYFNKVLVTTDDPELREVAKHFGAEAPFLRPSVLSYNSVSLDYVIIHATTWLEMNEGYWYDVISPMLPTYPLRSVREIDEAIETLLKGNYKSLIAIPPLKRAFGAHCFPLDTDTAQEAVLTFPDESVYAQSGYINLSYRWPNRSENIACLIPPERNIDIDTAEDLALCRSILEQKELPRVKDWLSSLDKIPPPKHIPPGRENMALVVSLSDEWVYYVLNKMPVICQTLQNAIDSAAGRVILAGTGLAADSLAEWSSLPLINVLVPSSGNNFPSAESLTDLKQHLKDIDHICILSGQGIISSKAIRQFANRYFDTKCKASVSASVPRHHPYWTKIIGNGSAQPCFDVPRLGQRQSLPTLSVENGLLKIAKTEEIAHRNTSPLGRNLDMKYGMMLNSDLSFRKYLYTLGTEDISQTSTKGDLWCLN